MQSVRLRRVSATMCWFGILRGKTVMAMELIDKCFSDDVLVWYIEGIGAGGTVDIQSFSDDVLVWYIEGGSTSI